MTIDLLYLSWNRLAFTRASFEALLANTDWSRIRSLLIYDDESTDGTYEWLLGRSASAGVPSVALAGWKHGSPVEAMRSYLAGSPAEAFAKIDNDVAVPAGWLPAMLSVLDADPTIDLLGMEAGMTQVAGRDGAAFDGVYGFEPATNVGGIGVFRTSAFIDRPELAPDGRFGFTEWQIENGLRRGWITPDLPVVLLDRLPLEPWQSLSRTYVDAGWQRPWQGWDPVWMEWAFEWFVAREAAA